LVPVELRREVAIPIATAARLRQLTPEIHNIRQRYRQRCNS
jgi:hypothetical protein